MHRRTELAEISMSKVELLGTELTYIKMQEVNNFLQFDLFSSKPKKATIFLFEAKTICLFWYFSLDFLVVRVFLRPNNLEKLTFWFQHMVIQFL